MFKNIILCLFYPVITYSINYSFTSRAELCEGYFTTKCVVEIPYFQDNEPTETSRPATKSQHSCASQICFTGIFRTLGSLKPQPTYYIYKQYCNRSYSNYQHNISFQVFTRVFSFFALKYIFPIELFYILNHRVQ